MKGSPYETFMAHSLSSYTMSWTQGTGVWYNGGVGSADFYSRPNGITIDLVPRLVGVAHTIKVFAVPIQPIQKSDITANPTGWPTDPNMGLTPTQVSWGGREFEIDPTSKGIRLCALPWDSRGFDFNNANTERLGIYAYGCTAWSGWIFWANGLGVSDKIDVVINCVEESMLKSIGVTTLYSAPTSGRVSDSHLKDVLSNKARSLADRGMAAYSMIDEVVDIAKTAWGVGKKISSVIGAMGGLFSPPLPPPPDDPESKDKDPPLPFPVSSRGPTSQSSSSSAGPDGRGLDTPSARGGVAPVSRVGMLR